MRREMELQLGDRLRALVASGPRPAATRFTTIDTARYTDAVVHAEEVATIASSPVAAIASTEVAGPGAFVTTQLAGTPVIITRDCEGQTHAMRNVCAHRGATVETREAGSTLVFSCGFHAWSYDLDGSLRSITDAGLWSSQPCTEGLRVLACEERHGIIWVKPDADAPTESVADWLGAEVDDLLDELGLHQMVHYATTTYDLASNWKLLIDGFLETYHLKYLHRGSIGPHFAPNASAEGRVGRHFVAWLPKNRLVTELIEQPRGAWKVLGRVTGAITLVPGTVILWQERHVELFSFRPHPSEPNRSLVRLTMLVPSDRADESTLWARNWERVCETILDEDFAAAVDVQSNIDAGAVDQIRLGANEHLVLDHLDSVRARSRGRT